MQTREQRLRSLGAGNDVRTRRAKLKKDLRAGRVPIDYVLTEVPDYVRTATIGDVLTWMPKIGRTTASQILSRMRLSPSKQMQDLSQGTRVRLLAALHRPRSFVRESIPTGDRETSSVASSLTG